MATQALVALDQGTTSTRAALYREGTLVAEARHSVQMVYPGAGRAEQDPRELFEASLAALDDVVSHLGENETAALGITAQRSTVILWDGETGKPFGPALSWRDSRAQPEAEALCLADSDLEVRTGLPPAPHYGAPKIVWALSNWPEARAAADANRLRVGPVSTWLTWKLSRGEDFTIDGTNAQRMHLLDLRTLEWHDALVDACSLPGSALPTVLPTDGFFGTAHVGGHSIPIRTVLGDQQAALIGLRGEAEGESVTGIHLGTGGFVLRDTGADYVKVPGLLGGLARADTNQPRQYLVEGPINSAGSSLDRMRESGMLRRREDVDAACKAAANPLTVVPAWAGLAAPHWESGAGAAVHGWEDATTRADFVAGTVRGLAFLAAEIIDAIRGHDLAVDRLNLSGPLSNIDYLARSIADACTLPVRIRTNPEAGIEGLGCALAAATGAPEPTLSLEAGREYEPARDLSRAREAFDLARDAALAIARKRE